jgi:fatty-acyl-CoA synthase
MALPPDADRTPSMADLVRARADDDHPALRWDGGEMSYRSYVAECAARAAWLDAAVDRTRPPHVAVLLENVPEFPLLLGAAALAGCTVVALNPTRRGPELARDLTHTRTQLVVTESCLRDLLDGVPASIERHDVDGGAWTDAIAAHAGAPVPDTEPDPAHPFLLIFTSGTTGAPKAAQVTHRRLALLGTGAGANLGLGPGKVVYVAMPMFHSNALFAGWAPALATGAAVALRRRFSATGFLPDVRRFGATYFNYVGKPLSYILATPEQPDDADNPLELVVGNEATVPDIKAFSQRFGCYVADNYGSTEGGITIVRTPETPDGALGEPRGKGVVVLDPATGEPCPPARFDASGQLLNAEECIGELASTTAASHFEGYWDNAEADAERTHDGIYWSGDLAYVDEQGFLWFAGRTDSWVRVDGENLAVAPIEHILLRHPDVLLAAAYAVPDERVGDAVMAALVMRPGATFDGEAFAAFIAAQDDLHAKGTPRYVRVAAELPMTPTNKVLVRQLRAEGVDCADPVWVRTTRGYQQRDAG